MSLRFFDRIAELKPELFIIAGDLIDFYIYPPAQREKIIATFQKLKNAGISTKLIQGNHDLDYTLLEELKTYTIVFIIKDNTILVKALCSVHRVKIIVKK